jgi:hypothetical protein
VESAVTEVLSLVTFGSSSAMTGVTLVHVAPPSVEVAAMTALRADVTSIASPLA